MSAYGQHVLISAIKYLDGAPNGHEGLYSASDRRAAIRIMLAKLSRATRSQLEKERAIFWTAK